MATNSHHQCHVRAAPAGAAGRLGCFWPGSCSPDSLDAKLGGSVVKTFLARFQESLPPVNFCETTSPSTAWSPTGAPSVPFAPPSLSHAAFMTPRTTNAPWAGVQKITGLSAAENVLMRLVGLMPPSVSLAVGSPRSLPAPPSDSYLARMSLSTALAPVAGLKKTFPPTNFCAIALLPTGYCPPCLAPSGPAAPPAERQAVLIAAVGSMGTWRPVSC